MSETYDAIVLGAGAAGLFCAATAGQRGKRVLLLDHADQVGKKILISGGGRCNFTNIHTAPDRYLSGNAHFAKSALSRYTPADFLDMVEAYGIAWHEKTLGQLFCDGSAKQIVAMLLEECARGGVTVHCGDALGEIDHADGHYRVAFGARAATAPALVIATGGPSIPKMGATGLAYDLARKFGLKVVQPRPALVPLTLPGAEALFRDLSGVSTEVVARCGKAAFREAALFTHRGLSGPAILQISSYWQRGQTVTTQFLPDRAEGWLKDAKRERPRASLRKVLGEGLPERLVDVLCERLGLSGELGAMSDKALAAAEAKLARWPFVPDGSEGYAKAEVTAGGIDTGALSSKTMEARKVPGLFVVGEAADVTGWLGGYNFQWAWASARAAGLAI
ncbi:NAD(P)/FAD-dependent oxidoreductase [Novosphingobium sp. TCA1]|uniref:NAD(P)/FAD-dependent oxidoreductase n=1 Tax=Novosphingobium sp. TCA1 TaxID=2682474 RepID=UPI00135A303F|nr:NAD(P)/FAD-dependent oxidoreductase [Novosphingobium sp. TCA1]